MRYILSAAFLYGASVSLASAGAVETSIRPEMRMLSSLVAQPASAPTIALATSIRPEIRPTSRTTSGTTPAPRSEQGFQTWLKEFKHRAEANGIKSDILRQAFRGVRYDADIIRRDRNQSEFTKTIWDYLDSAASDTRIANGKAALIKHRATLEAIESRYGVDKEVVVAVWGLESAYGTFRGSENVIASLATLAFDGRRGAFFEGQLIAALTILQSGDTQARNMTGSWAGAMGHTQFMPTSYLDHAVDFTGDGRRDIWSDDPTDALASTAAYLKHFGWIQGQPWGVEVQLPDNFDYAQAKRSVTRLPSAWARMGVLGTNGQAVPDHGPATVLLPAGGRGAAFLIFDNFEVIERYNTADAYVIGIGHLSDRIRGGPPIQAGWPREDRALTYKERKELQERLTQAGFDTKKIDGKIGPLTIAAVRGFQIASGLIPDGYASFALLQQLR